MLWAQSVDSGWEPDNLYCWLGMYSESLCLEEKPTGSVTGPSSESGCGSGCDSDGGSGLEFAGLDEPVLWSGSGCGAGLDVAVVFPSSLLAAADGSSCEHFYF